MAYAGKHVLFLRPRTPVKNAYFSSRDFLLE